MSSQLRCGRVLAAEWMKKTQLAAKAENPTLACEAAARALKNLHAALTQHDELHPYEA